MKFETGRSIHLPSAIVKTTACKTTACKTTARLARECGFSLAVTCDERLVEPGGDSWRLPRVEVKPVMRGDLARRLQALARATVTAR